MNEVVILIPIVNMPQNRTEEQLVLFMGMAVQTLVDLGALKGNVDDILKDYYVDEATNYINITVPSDVIGLTNELEAVGAATCPTYKVVTDLNQYIDPVDGEIKTFSAATINERLRIAMRNPKLRFRYTIMDYKKFYKQKESQLKKNPEMVQKLRNMFLTDVMGMFTEVLPQIEDGKQLATLVGTSQVTSKLNKVARELSMAYRKALRMEKSSGQINKGSYARLKKSYTQFMTELLDQVFPGLNQSTEQKQESRRYSFCKDGRIDLFAEPTPEQVEREAEDEVLDEETRALNEDLMHFEEESQKEYSELGENTYFVVKYVPKNKNVDYYYYDLISELHPLYGKLMKVKVNQTISDDDFIITKLTDNIDFNDALKWMKQKGVKSFSRDGLTEVSFKTSNPEQLTKIVNAIGECGNGGHSFDIVIDPDLSEADGGNKKFGWDGDGSDYIEVEDKTFSFTRIPVHNLSTELAKDLGVQGSYVAVTSITLIPHDNKMDISFNDQRFKNFEDRVIKEIPELGKGSSNKSSTEKKKLAFIIDDKYNLVKVVVVPDDVKLGGIVYPISVSFSENREKVSAEMLEKAKTDGVVQKKPNGSWGIISIDAGEWWTPDYESEEKAKNALEAYHANKFGE